MIKEPLGIINNARRWMLGHFPRMTVWTFIAAIFVGVVFLWAGVELVTLAYKGALVAAFAVGGYWIDRECFPYARPDEVCPQFKDHTLEWSPADATVAHGLMIRRAIIIGACILGGALGL